MNAGSPVRYLPGAMPDELVGIVRECGEPAFRAKQLAQWLYEKWVFDPQEMKNLPAPFRDRLAERFGAPRSRVAERASGSGGTTKLLLQLDDGEAIEMVLIPSPERMTFCLSSQVGCPVRCRFCASGQNGLIRNLRADEILEEFYWGVRENGGAKPDNVVFMGIGEGLLNFAALSRALTVLTEPDCAGMSPRRITVSTSGCVPGIRKLAAMGKPFTLAISLHAVDEETRAKLIPDPCRTPIAEILQAADAYQEAVGRMVTFEYTLIAGINDDPAMAKALAELARKHHAKVNLIACNPIGKAYARPADAVIQRFFKVLEDSGAGVTLRVEKGSSAASACGQLRAARNAKLQDEADHANKTSA